MKVTNTFLLMAAAFLPALASAQCPRTEGGAIDYSAIPPLSIDATSDITNPSPTYYFDTGNQQWSLTDTGSGYSTSVTDVAEIKNIAICIDTSTQTLDGLAMYFRITAGNYPLAYKNAADSKSYVLGMGPLGADVGLPEDMDAIMAFSFVDTNALAEGAYIYSLVPRIKHAAGETFVSAIVNGFPKSFYVVRSAKPVRSKGEFIAYRLKTSDIIVSSFNNQPGQLADYKEVNPTTGEATPQFNVEQGMKEFSKASGIGLNSSVLIKLHTYTGNTDALAAAQPQSTGKKARKRFLTVTDKLRRKDTTRSAKTKLKR